jgi:hypothetical protein
VVEEEVIVLQGKQEKEEDGALYKGRESLLMRRDIRNVLQPKKNVPYKEPCTNSKQKKISKNIHPKVQKAK